MTKLIFRLSLLPSLLVFILAFLGHSYFFDLDKSIALRGFSILEVLEADANPQAFERDFPGGARLTTANSPAVFLFRIGLQVFGLSKMGMLYGMILLEIATLAGGAFLLWRSLLSLCGASPEQQLAGFVFSCLLAVLLTSHLQRANLANFGFPFFHGQFYGFADGLRLAGLAMVLQKRWLWGAAIYSLCFILHPIKGLIGMAFALPFALLDWRAILSIRFAVGVAAIVSVIVIWSLQLLDNGGTNVPTDDFIAYTKTFQFHWYPMDFGLFGKLHLRGYSPFMALSSVRVHSARRRSSRPRSG